MYIYLCVCLKQQSSATECGTFLCRVNMAEEKKDDKGGKLTAYQEEFQRREKEYDIAVDLCENGKISESIEKANKLAEKAETYSFAGLIYSFLSAAYKELYKERNNNNKCRFRDESGPSLEDYYKSIECLKIASEFAPWAWSLYGEAARNYYLIRKYDLSIAYAQTVVDNEKLQTDDLVPSMKQLITLANARKRKKDEECIIL